ncbi:adenylate kinase [Candidatus Shapirobacteria bacterium CG03_land_8_20_14_0_80_39_12]|uniref:Adenylate kinase n=1 Tax=Candidatus Shapirobacteria bacterium CG03_land_8_20_14_0_80_39_12 TaxID=1974879 RepID=A0A2M7BEN4_9BACT|nr:MAG: adenylate kinase [Candidatus Shapirobacteria bacterium CG03_land_8_20_14_0_80_39_12]
MNILIIGPQGSGKGTQAEKLIEKFKMAHIEMGGLLRTIARKDSPLGNQVKNFIDNGRLVTDEITIRVLNNYLQGFGRIENVLFDGFPRVLSQAQYFEKFLAEKEKKLDVVIFLTLPREEIFKRLANRRTCEKCGKVFNILTKPPKVEGICDFCGGNLIIRIDETPEKISERLSQFEEQTIPMINFFKEKGIVEEVDGNRPIDIIFQDIIGRLKKRNLIKDA